MNRLRSFPQPRPWPFWRAIAFMAALLALTTALSSPVGLQMAWLLIGAPIAEEVVFRLGVQSSLQTAFGRAAALVMSAALFALCHAIPSSPSGQTLVPWLTFFPGLAFAASYAWRGQLHECVALHGLCNALWLIAPSLTPPFRGLQ